MDIKLANVYELFARNHTQKSETQLTPKRHPNYNKVKDLIARCVIANMDYAPTCREIERLIGVGNSSVSRHIQDLCEEGWLCRVKVGKSNRTICYRIIINKEQAIEYRNIFTPTGRKRKQKNRNAWGNGGAINKHLSTGERFLIV